MQEAFFPYLKEKITYSYDDTNRRFFPPNLEKKPKAGVSNYAWPDCSAVTEDDRARVGCLSIPYSQNLQDKPAWAGTLHSGKTPSCKEGRCDLLLPQSNDALGIPSISTAAIGGDDTTESESAYYLKHVLMKFLSNSGKDASVTAFGVADVNLDGLPDVIIGYYGQPNRLLLKGRNGVFEKAAAGALSSSYGGDSKNTTSLAIRDIDLDGFPDVLVGNFGEPNTLLLNQRNGTFKQVEIELGGKGTTALQCSLKKYSISF